MGEKIIVERIGARQVVRMDSISYVDASNTGQIVVSGSHGGASSARYALEMCFLDDAAVALGFRAGERVADAIRRVYGGS